MISPNLIQDTQRRISRPGSCQVLDEISEKNKNSTESQGEPSTAGHFYSKSQGTDSLYYSTASMPTRVVVNSDNSKRQGPYSNVNVQQTWSENKKLIGSEKDTKTSNFLAPPGIQVEADMNTGISFEEMQTMVTGKNSKTKASAI